MLTSRLPPLPACRLERPVTPPTAVADQDIVAALREGSLPEVLLALGTSSAGNSPAEVCAAAVAQLVERVEQAARGGQPAAEEPETGQAQQLEPAQPGEVAQAGQGDHREPAPGSASFGHWRSPRPGQSQDQSHSLGHAHRHLGRGAYARTLTPTHPHPHGHPQAGGSSSSGGEWGAGSLVPSTPAFDGASTTVRLREQLERVMRQLFDAQADATTARAEVHCLSEALDKVGGLASSSSSLLVNFLHLF